MKTSVSVRLSKNKEAKGKSYRFWKSHICNHQKHSRLVLNTLMKLLVCDDGLSCRLFIFSKFFFLWHRYYNHYFFEIKSILKFFQNFSPTFSYRFSAKPSVALLPDLRQQIAELADFTGGQTCEHRDWNSCCTVKTGYTSKLSTYNPFWLPLGRCSFRVVFFA